MRYMIKHPLILLGFLLALFVVVRAHYFVTWEDLHRVSTVEEFHTNVRRVVEEFACEDCRKHFEDLVNTHVIPLDRVETLEEARIYMWLAHNMVNVRIGNPWYPLSVLDQYNDKCKTSYLNT